LVFFAFTPVYICLLPWPQYIWSKVYSFLYQNKACDDVGDKSASSEGEYETDEEWETERKQQAAVLEKDKVGIVTMC